MPGGQSASVVGGLTGFSELNTSALRGEAWPRRRVGGDLGAAVRGAAGLTWWPAGGSSVTGRRNMLSIEKGRAFGLVSLSADEI